MLTQVRSPDAGNDNRQSPPASLIVPPRHAAEKPGAQRPQKKPPVAVPWLTPAQALSPIDRRANFGYAKRNPTGRHRILVCQRHPT